MDVTVILAGLEEERQYDTVDSVMFPCPERKHSSKQSLEPDHLV